MQLLYYVIRQKVIVDKCHTRSFKTNFFDKAKTEHKLLWVYTDVTSGNMPRQSIGLYGGGFSL